MESGAKNIRLSRPIDHHLPPLLLHLQLPLRSLQHPIELGAYDVSLSGQEGHHQTFATMTPRPLHPHPHPNQTEV